MIYITYTNTDYPSKWGGHKRSKKKNSINIRIKNIICPFKKNSNKN